MKTSVKDSQKPKLILKTTNNVQINNHQKVIQQSNPTNKVTSVGKKEP